MIVLNQDKINTVVVTLCEKVTLTGDTYFLFELISDDSNESKLFTGFDISTNKSRYNQFNVTLTGGTEDLLNGVVTLPINGSYDYKVYEQTSPTNLDISGTTSVVEIGKALVIGDKLPEVIEYTGGSTNKIVYNG